MGTTPTARLTSSVILQSLADANLFLLKKAIAMTKSIVNDSPNAVVFPAVPHVRICPRLLGWSDAAFSPAPDAHGQQGFVAGIIFPPAHGSDPVAFHFIEAVSAKLKRVVYSSYGAEILAAAESDNRLHGLREGLRQVLQSPIESEGLYDSNGLFTCLTTLSYGHEYLSLIHI